MRNKLQKNNILFIQNQKFDDCRNVLPLPFDFYIPDSNLLIECDGIHHYEPVKHFGGEDRLEYQQHNDNIKNNYCKEKGIKLIRVKSYKEIDKISVLQ